MSDVHPLSRRSLLLGAAGAAGLATAGALGAPGAASAAPAGTGPLARTGSQRPPLWRLARPNGLAFGTSVATWQLTDAPYQRLVDREAALLFTEDDLLWYRLKPTPDAELDFTYADQIVAYAEAQQMAVFGAHLVWDEGFGEGWTEDDLWGLSEQEARELLLGTAEAVVRRYRGRVGTWSVANEVTSPEGRRGYRTDVPWWEPIGKSYVADAFHVAHAADPSAVLVLNEFGFETVNEYGDEPEPRRRATLQVIDDLLRDGVPVHALGVQAHLLADRFADRFRANAYLDWFSEVADRGLDILITELDVLDDGLPADIATRDAAVADVYRRYLDVALSHRSVKAVMAFGLTDRYTWLEEDYPREDGAPRRPLAFDDELAPKPAYRAIANELSNAPRRSPLRSLLP
ncbi:endo-1,4-beta-xylanase [Micromonospora sp. U21]|uniref:endo-1,4-beta-xylanase n=1 Tax=Micromonospora sp. U21 TaxID=2824899 RepID=UPI001B361A28|nr:endo-1,4-beta-xylanase [Micromonospora sp. U21]MBQ0904224.1 endo-1,4-beta-xylanase [Micromonospora sp. U21]